MCGGPIPTGGDDVRRPCGLYAVEVIFDLISEVIGFRAASQLVQCGAGLGIPDVGVPVGVAGGDDALAVGSGTRLR